MASIDQAKALSQAIVIHVCNYLSIDNFSIRTIFSPRLEIEPILGIPQFVTVLNDDTIVIGEDFLDSCCHSGFTRLHHELYMRIRFIVKRREKNGNLGWNEAMNDAFAFSSALLFLNGNQLPCPNGMNPSQVFDGALKLLDREFGMSGTIFKVSYNGEIFYKVRLSDEKSKEVLQKYMTSIPFCAKGPSGNEKRDIGQSIR